MAEQTRVVAGLFVSVTQTGYDLHDQLLKQSRFQNYSIELVRPGDTSCEDADIVVCSSLQALFSVLDYIHDDMCVIVCDGPLPCSCLVTATPLDYVQQRSYHFSFRPVEFKPVLTALLGKQSSVELRVESFDVLGLVTANSVSGDLILTSFNKVQSYFDALARNRLRFLFIQLFDPGDVHENVVELQKFLKKECTKEQHRADALEFWQALFKQGAFRRLRDAFQAMEAGKTPTSAAKKYDVPLFELNYIRRLSGTIDKTAARTEAFNTRTKSIEA